jgi:predicted small lipoprotein YifL
LAAEALTATVTAGVHIPPKTGKKTIARNTRKGSGKEHTMTSGALIKSFCVAAALVVGLSGCGRKGDLERPGVKRSPVTDPAETQAARSGNALHPRRIIWIRIPCREPF